MGGLNVSWDDDKLKIEGLADGLAAAASAASDVNRQVSTMTDMFTQVRELMGVIGSKNLMKASDEKLMKFFVDNMKKSKKEAEDLLKTIRNIQNIASKTSFGKTVDGLKEGHRFLNQWQTKVTGLDLSLGGIVALIVEAYNQMRKINGLAIQAAGSIGAGAANVKATTGAMFELRGAFRSDYDEAANLVGQLTTMGFLGDELASKSFMPKNSEEVARLNEQMVKSDFERARFMEEATKATEQGGAALEDQLKRAKEFDKLQRESLGLQQSINKEVTKQREENEKSRKNYIEEVGLVKELTALDKLKILDMSTSGGLVKAMRQDYGETSDKAREILEKSLQNTFALQKSLATTGAMAGGVKELISDWAELIQYSKAYRTDLLGVQGLYYALRKAAEGIPETFPGMKGISKSVIMDITRGMVSAPLKMDIGWKARLGEGVSPAARILEFENLSKKEGGAGEIFTRVLNEVKSTMGDISKSPAEAEIRARKIFESLGTFSQEAGVELSRRMASGQLDPKKAEAYIKQQIDLQKKQDKDNKVWKTERNKLITYAEISASNIRSVQELIKQWAIDNLMNLIIDIKHLLEDIAAAFGSTSAKRKVEERSAEEQLQRLGLYGISAGKVGGLSGIEDLQEDIAEAKNKMMLSPARGLEKLGLKQEITPQEVKEEMSSMVGSKRIERGQKYLDVIEKLLTSTDKQTANEDRRLGGMLRSALKATNIKIVRQAIIDYNRGYRAAAILELKQAGYEPGDVDTLVGPSQNK